MRLKVLFLPLSVVVFLYLMIWFVKPAWSDYREMAKESEKIQEQLNNLKRDQQAIEKAASSYNSYSSEAELIKRLLPNSPFQQAVVSEMQKMASQQGLYINSIKFINPDDDVLSKIDSKKKGEAASSSLEDKFKKVTVEASLTGEYLSFRRYVGELEKMTRYSFLEVFSISEKNENNLQKMAIGFNVYYEDEEDSFSLSKYAVKKNAVLSALSQGKYSIETIDKYKKLRNVDFQFNPDLSNAGKNNLFSSGSGGGDVSNEQETQEQEPATEQTDAEELEGEAEEAPEIQENDEQEAEVSEQI